MLLLNDNNSQNADAITTKNKNNKESLLEIFPLR